MANHKSAIKRARQNNKRRARNEGLRSQMRTELKKAITAVSKAASRADALKALADADKSLQKAVSKHVVPKARASRKVARVAALVNKKFAPTAAARK